MVSQVESQSDNSVPAARKTALGSLSGSLRGDVDSELERQERNEKRVTFIGQMAAIPLGIALLSQEVNGLEHLENLLDTLSTSES